MEYYTQFRYRTGQPSSDLSFHPEYSNPRDESGQTPPFTLEDRSIYIFPSPPSALQSPSVSPEPSGPIHFISPGNGRRSRDTGLVSTGTHSSDLEWENIITSPSLRSQAEFTNSDDAVSDLTANPSVKYRESILEQEIERINRWNLVSFQQRRQDTVSRPLVQTGQEPLIQSRITGKTSSPIRSHCHPAPDSLSPGPSSPCPRIHVPLLSFLSTILSIDDSTIHLITHSPSHSTLFPGLCPLQADKDVCDDDMELHGVAKLLSSSAEEDSLLEGVRVASSSSFSFSSGSLTPPFLFMSLFDLVKCVWVGGGKAFRETWR